MKLFWIDTEEVHPRNEPGKWSEDVLVFTDHNRMFYIACMDGHWQRPSFFKKGEKVLFWAYIELPKL